VVIGSRLFQPSSKANEARVGFVVMTDAEPFLFDAPLAVNPMGKRGRLGPSGRERIAHDRYLFHDPIGATSLSAMLRVLGVSRHDAIWDFCAGDRVHADAVGCLRWRYAMWSDIAPPSRNVEKVDVLSVTAWPKGIRVAASNGPFNLFDKIARHLIALAEPVAGIVVLLLPDYYLTTPSRRDLFHNVAYAGSVRIGDRVCWFEPARGQSVPNTSFSWHAWNHGRDPSAPPFGVVHYREEEDAAT
jgi:hypothetical protein